MCTAHRDSPLDAPLLRNTAPCAKLRENGDAHKDNVVPLWPHCLVTAAHKPEEHRDELR